ncbi:MULTISPECIES: hypothetical protein [unclassified Sphingomonas]|uniref:hypothetical protein n=1 Tax=unclassified Sphingomonas TaxID=196159 RepID=UPI0006F3BBD6|nr:MULTISPECIES: hypothetical protein [unclassified Sphingomonas]KQX22665.1 hypothetical protein ASD17_05075 [Sphingomonas sp. Root1294]KQY67856.1 hypothetical protein ASD39_08055 [Sphingomonas sp. Root50]KRB88779.1 hypothetical protein ASE22_20400 [Sphingomonas sp. Root720]
MDDKASALRFSVAQAGLRHSTAMTRPLLALLFLALPAAVAAQTVPGQAVGRAAPDQGEDAEHRADRLRTIELNRRAQSVVDRRDRSNMDVRERNRRAQDHYQRERAEWRRRVAACNAGDHDACGS